MTNEDLPHGIKEDPRETNVEHEYQGKLRRSLLDLDLLDYSISRAKLYQPHKPNLVITCLDHLDGDYRFTQNWKIVKCKDKEDFAMKISEHLGTFSVYGSSSPETSLIEQIY